MAFLAFTTGTKRLYIWSEDGASVCDLPFEPHEFKASTVIWAPDG